MKKVTVPEGLQWVPENTDERWLLTKVIRDACQSWRIWLNRNEYTEPDLHVLLEQGEEGYHVDIFTESGMVEEDGAFQFRVYRDTGEYTGEPDLDDDLLVMGGKSIEILVLGRLGILECSYGRLIAPVKIDNGEEYIKIGQCGVVINPL